MHTEIAMPPRWPHHIKTEIKAALAACAPACVLSTKAVEELMLSTGLTAAQIKRSAENFRFRVNVESRAYMLAPQSHDHAAVDEYDDYVFNPLPHANKLYQTRYSNEVLSHLVNAIKRPENCHARRFTEGAVLMLMHTTHLSARSIRKWASRYHRRDGKVHFAQPKVPRKERIRARKEAMKRAHAAEEAEDLRICEVRRAAAAAEA